MKGKAPTPREVRAARSFLVSKGVPLSAISPRMFAKAAKEQSRGFRELLQFIARLYAGGQNQSGWRQEAILRQLNS